MTQRARKSPLPWLLLAILLLASGAWLLRFMGSSGGLQGQEESQGISPTQPAEGASAPSPSEPQGTAPDRIAVHNTPPPTPEETRDLRWRLLDLWGNPIPQSTLSLSYQNSGRELQEVLESDEQGWVPIPPDLARDSVVFLGMGDPGGGTYDLALGQRTHKPLLDQVLVRRQAYGQIHVELEDGEGLLTSEPFYLLAFDGENLPSDPLPVAQGPVVLQGKAHLPLQAGFYTLAVCVRGAPWLEVQRKGVSSRIYVQPGSTKTLRVRLPEWEQGEVSIIEPSSIQTEKPRPLARAEFMPLGLPKNEAAFQWSTDSLGRAAKRIPKRKPKKPRGRKRGEQPLLENTFDLAPRETLLVLRTGVRKGALILVDENIGTPMRRADQELPWSFGPLLGRGGQVRVASLYGDGEFALDPDLPWEEGMQAPQPIRVLQPDVLQVSASYPKGDWLRVETRLTRPSTLGTMVPEPWNLVQEFRSHVRLRAFQLPLVWQLSSPESGLSWMRIWLRPNRDRSWSLPAFAHPNFQPEVSLLGDPSFAPGHLVVGVIKVRSASHKISRGRETYETHEILCVDTQGEPVPHAWVSAYQARDGLGIRHSMADEKGRLTLHTLGGGTTWMGPPALPSDAWIPVEPRKFQRAKTLLRIPEKAYSIEVQVQVHPHPEDLWVLVQGNLHPGKPSVPVTLTAKPNRDGLCHFAGLAEGNYSVTVTPGLDKVIGNLTQVALQPQSPQAVLWLDVDKKEFR